MVAERVRPGRPPLEADLSARLPDNPRQHPRSGLRTTQRGEHQVADQAHQDQREGAAANKSVKSSLKTAIRKYREAADAGDTAAATTLMRDASKALDKAASKGVIHANQAANRKSAMAKRASQLSSTSS